MLVLGTRTMLGLSICDTVEYAFLHRMIDSEAKRRTNGADIFPDSKHSSDASDDIGALRSW
jgi:hypothetical protein